MGIYVFNIESLRQRLIEDTAQSDSIHDFGHVILPKMVNLDRVFAYKFNGYWQDIGTPEAYHKANIEFTHDHPALRMDSDWPVFTGDENYARFNMYGNGQIKNSIIGSGCVIKGRVVNSILSPGVWVGQNAVIKDSVIMDNVSIGCHTKVTNCILDEDAAIGEYCNIGIKTNPGMENTDITVLGQNSKVPSHTDINNYRGMIRPAPSPDDSIEGVFLDMVEPRLNPMTL
jgi:glucose-1-phosphate adenylyltransferase